MTERAAWALAFVCLAGWGAFYLAGVIGARGEVNRFGVLRAAAKLRAGSPDQSLWSEERVRAWQSTLKRSGSASPRGVAGSADRSRGGGAGGHRRLHSQSRRRSHRRTRHRRFGWKLRDCRTSRRLLPGAEGHHPGDVIELETLDGSEVYRVERTWIVDPEDVSVLDPTPARSLTLVTCYPFYFIGSAPRRFIVRAVRADEAVLQKLKPLNGT